MSKVTQITPFVMTHNLDNALAFFVDVLGFTLGYREDNYAFLRNDGAAIRLIEVDESCAIAEQMVYLDTPDVDAVYADLRPRLDELPDDRVRAPFEQPYGMRELHIKDSDNCLLMYGTPVSQP